MDEFGAKLWSRNGSKLHERITCEVGESLEKTAQMNSMQNRRAARRLEHGTNERKVEQSLEKIQRNLMQNQRATGLKRYSLDLDVPTNLM